MTFAKLLFNLNLVRLQTDKIVSNSEVSDKKDMLKLKGIEDNIAYLKDQLQKLEAEYEKEQHDHSKVSFNFFIFAWHSIPIFQKYRI